MCEVWAWHSFQCAGTTINRHALTTSLTPILSTGQERVQQTSITRPTECGSQFYALINHVIMTK